MNAMPVGARALQWVFENQQLIVNYYYSQLKLQRKMIWYSSFVDATHFIETAS